MKCFKTWLGLFVPITLHCLYNWGRLDWGGGMIIGNGQYKRGSTVHGHNTLSA